MIRCEENRHVRELIPDRHVLDVSDFLRTGHVCRGACPSLKTLADFDSGRLLEAETPALRQHLQFCEACRVFVDRADYVDPACAASSSTSGGLRGMGERRSRLALPAALGVVVLAAALVLFLRTEQGAIVAEIEDPGAPAVVDEAAGDVTQPRQAALAVLEIGGRVEIKGTDFDPRWVDQTDELPSAPFTIEWIEVHRDRAEPITVDWLREVLAGAPALQGIALHEQILGDEAMPLLAKSASLTHAMLSDVGITDAGLAALAGLPLAQLNAGKNQIGDHGIRALGTPAHLRLLVLTDTDVTDEALRHIAEWPQLQSLSLASTAITDRGLARLEELTSLREIDLDGTLVTRAGVASFRRALPGCRVTSNFTP